MSTSTAPPIAEGIFTWPAGEPHLLGGSCPACGVVTFPLARSCPRCGSEDVTEIELSRRGTLWTWTTQGFLPKHPYAGTETPETFEPFLLGYVELPEGVRVEARLIDCDPGTVRIGQEMELAIVPFETRDRGERLTYAFRPATTEVGK